MPNTPPKSLPLMGFPPEIRDQVWEESFLAEESGDAQLELTKYGFRDFGPAAVGSAGLARGFVTRFRLPRPLAVSAVAQACRESHAAVERLTAKRPAADHHVPVITSLDNARTDSLLPLLAHRILILDLGHELEERPWERPPSRPADLPGPFRNSDHRRRLIELLLASRAGQIKLLIPDTADFILDGALHDAAPSFPLAVPWVRDTDIRGRIAAVSDAEAWGELADIATHYGYPWPLVDAVLEGGAARDKLVEDATAALRRLWEEENEARTRAGEHPLPSMPRCDVVVQIAMTVGGPESMLGFRGVPNREALSDLIQWGIL